MPTPSSNPSPKRIKVKVSRPDPEDERIVQAVQIKILREAGYLPLKPSVRDER